MNKESENPDILGRAIRKSKHGYGTTNSEKKALYDYNRGLIGRDHFATIHTAPVREPTAADEPKRAIRASDSGTQIGTGKDTLQRPADTYDDAALTASVGAVETTTATHTGQISTHTTNITANADAITALTNRVVTLENLVLNLTRQSVSYCTGGSTSTKTILMS